MTFWTGFTKHANAQVDRAIKAQKNLKITYRKANGRTVKRVITPLKHENGLIKAYDHKRKNYRTFKTERLKEVMAAPGFWEGFEKRASRYTRYLLNKNIPFSKILLRRDGLVNRAIHNEAVKQIPGYKKLTPASADELIPQSDKLKRLISTSTKARIDKKRIKDLRRELRDLLPPKRRKRKRYQYGVNRK